MLYLPEQGNGNNKNPMIYYDSDSDGISDGEEVLVLGSYPFSFDSDSDGLSDGMEFIFYKLSGLNKMCLISLKANCFQRVEISKIGPAGHFSLRQPCGADFLVGEAPRRNFFSDIFIRKRFPDRLV